MDLYVLDLAYNVNGQQSVLHPVVLRSGTQTLLVDCGYAGSLPLLEEALNKHSLSLRLLSGVIITHHDIDHMGAGAELKAHYPALKVYASALEKEYINGSKRGLRLQQAEDLYACLPDDQKEGARLFQERLKNVRPVAVDETLPLDEELAFMPGVQVIHTPGHMPGHISLYLPGQKTLVAADALVLHNGALELANPQFTLDLPAAIATVKKLQRLPIDTVVCYHGGVLSSNVPGALAALVAQYALA